MRYTLEREQKRAAALALGVRWAAQSKNPWRANK